MLMDADGECSPSIRVNGNDANQTSVEQDNAGVVAQAPLRREPRKGTLETRHQAAANDDFRGNTMAAADARSRLNQQYQR